MPTRFLAEIDQMPAALDGLVSWYAGQGRERLLAFRALLRGKQGILFGGMGTSLIASRIVFPRLGKLGIACRSADAGEWLHYGTDTPDADSLIVLTSQSGESVEVKRLVGEGRVAGYVAITNNEASSLGAKARLVLPLLAGEEASISTKTYTNTLAVLHLLASALQGDEALDRGVRELREAARLMGEADTGAIQAAAEALAPAAGIAFVARGPAHVAAQQCALTFMEGGRSLAAAFTGGAFNHGPAELLEPGFRLVILQSGERTRWLAEGLADRAARLGAGVVLLRDALGAAMEGVRVCSVPRVAHADDPDELFPLLTARTQNLLLHHVAARRGIEAGIFRHGGKVTRNE
jgi:glucosamine--fructose-6-phosphate aminotransferase (isomerizing)